MTRCIVYIGDFDIRNENVQSHLVRNNGKIFNELNFHVEFIGINRNIHSFDDKQCNQIVQLDDGNSLFELPDTLNVSGLLKTPKVSRLIISRLDFLSNTYDIESIITYQSPTYAVVLKKIAEWCICNHIPYIVNCADLPIFDQQSFIRRIVMKNNWSMMHKINQEYASGIIAVSKYIEDFYRKPNRHSVVIPPLFDSKNKNNNPTVKNEIPTFIYAGTPFKAKGQEIKPQGMKDRLDCIIDMFLKVSQKGEKYIFNIVGISKEEYISGVPRHADSLRKEERIQFMGRKSHAETLNYVSLSDFSINYRDENIMTLAGYSTKIVESVSLGTPVVINDIGDTFRYLEQNVTGIKLSKDEAESVKIITALCRMPVEERFELKEKCKSAEVFEWRKFVGLIDAFLTKIRQD